MLRALTAGLMILAASGCNLGLHSAIDAAPFEARMTDAPFADGVYCKMAKREDGGLMVSGQLGVNKDECSTLTWDIVRRLFVQRNAHGAEAELKFVDLGGQFFMMQLQASYGDEGRPFAFTLWAGVTEGDAFMIIPISYGEELAQIGAQHPGIDFSIYKPPNQAAPDPALAPDGAKVEPLVENPDVFYISGGSPADIRDLARDILDWVLMGGASPPEDARKWRGEGIMVLDQLSKPDHSPSAKQQRDIDAMVDVLLAHLPPAP